MGDDGLTIIGERQLKSPGLDAAIPTAVGKAEVARQSRGHEQPAIEAVDGQCLLGIVVRQVALIRTFGERFMVETLFSSMKSCAVKNTGKDQISRAGLSVST